MAVRSPQEIFAHHADVLIKADIDGIVSDYAEDAVLITAAGIRRGKAGVREGFEELLGALPNANFSVPVQQFVDDLLYIEWTATSANSSVADGVDTFVFRDGLIRAQTLRCTVDRQA